MALIFIECGTAMSSPFNTGIQRVVRSIVRELESMGHSYGQQCIPVRFAGTQFHVVDTAIAKTPELPAPRESCFSVFVSKLAKLLPWVPCLRIYQKILRIMAALVRPGRRKIEHDASILSVQDMFKDKREGAEHAQTVSTPPILLLLDSTWDMHIWPVVDEFRASGGHVCAVLYDLIPFTHPDTVEEHTRELHTSWWLEAPLHLDSVLCISQAVRDQFLSWQQEVGLSRRLAPEQVAYFYLGSELHTENEDDDQLSLILDRKDPYFLVVGSIEPRKNHDVILDAFEILWQEGKRVNLVIVGGHGWKSEAFIDRVSMHPMYKKRLFLLRKTTDAELVLLYSQTAALIMASIAEGFGLPIVEAFQRGAEVICSDIPVFREIAEDHATYFDPASPISLARTISQKYGPLERSLSQKRTSGTVSWITWKQSAEQLLLKLLACVESNRH